MTDDKSPHRTVAPGGTSPDRFAREAEALRANLAKRKAQQRARRAGAAGVGGDRADAEGGQGGEAGGSAKG